MKTYQSKETQEKRFLKIIKKTKIYNQKQFAKEYEEYYGKIAQSTISTYFDEFNIIKGKDRAYFQDDSDDISDLISQTCYEVSNIHNDFFHIIVKCDFGSELNVCKAITEKFSHIESSVIPAYGAVVILCRLGKNAKNIHSYIKRYRIRRYNEEE